MKLHAVHRRLCSTQLREPVDRLDEERGFPGRGFEDRIVGVPDRPSREITGDVRRGEESTARFADRSGVGHPVIVADGTDKFGHRNADDSTALIEPFAGTVSCGVGAPESVVGGRSVHFRSWLSLGFGPE